MTLKRVTMNLTQRDTENAQSIKDRLNTRSRAGAVSASLALTEGLTHRIESGDELLIRRKNGDLERVMIPGLPVNE